MPDLPGRNGWGLKGNIRHLGRKKEKSFSKAWFTSCCFARLLLWSWGLGWLLAFWCRKACKISWSKSALGVSSQGNSLDFGETMWPLGIPSYTAFSRRVIPEASSKFKLLPLKCTLAWKRRKWSCDVWCVVFLSDCYCNSTVCLRNGLEGFSPSSFHLGSESQARSLAHAVPSVKQLRVCVEIAFFMCLQGMGLQELILLLCSSLLALKTKLINT